jgi:hypothetical protein
MRGSWGIMPEACLRPRLLGHKKSRDFRAFRESPYLRIPQLSGLVAGRDRCQGSINNILYETLLVGALL